MSSSGMTLTSIMVALAIPSVTAVFGTRIITDQFTVTNTIALMDKGEAIFRFYSSLVLDSDAWQETLNRNTALKKYVKSHNISIDPSSTRNSVALYDSVGNVMLQSGRAKLKDEILGNVTGGWWEIEASWKKMGRGSVDLILELCLNKTTFKNDPKNDGKKNIANTFKFFCPNKKRITRVRYSENSVQVPATTCGGQGKAIIKISRHSASSSRVVTCSTYKLVNTALTCPNRTLVYAIRSGSGRCSLNRTGVFAQSCSGGRHIQVSTSGVRCSSNSFLLNTSRTRCDVDRWGNPANGVVCGFDSQRRVQCCSSRGPRGAQGYRGLTGIQGIQGPQGYQGYRGYRGPTETRISTIVGPRGARGPKGEPATGRGCRT